MQVVELRAFDGPAGLFQTARSEPTPKANEIVLRIRAVSLNYRDIVISRGRYGRLELPLIVGSDAVGEVIARGDEVSRFDVGDRVCPQYIMDWQSGRAEPSSATRRLGGPTDGVLSQLLCIPEHAAVRAPHHMSDAGAATLPIAALTAWQALFVRGNLQPGQTLVVQGSGGVSIFAMQLALACGARVVATSSSDEKLERLAQMGAAMTINYQRHRDWHEQVLEFTEGRGADQVIEVVGGKNLTKSIKATRMAGRISAIGFLEGPLGEVDLRDAFRLSISLDAISVGARDSFEDLVRACEANKLKPVISDEFAFEEFRSAYEQLESGRHFGKVVIKIAN